MDVNKIRSLAQQIIDETYVSNGGGTGSNIIKVNAGSNLQSVHDNVPEGSVLALESGTYEGELRPTKMLTWQPQNNVPSGLPNPTFAPVVIRSGGNTVLNRSRGSIFSGIQFLSGNPDQTIFTDEGENLILDRITMLGDKDKGQHRGFMPHGVNCTGKLLFIDNCGTLGRDSQAIGAYNGTKKLTLDSCFLAGAAQSLFFGGADFPSEDMMPQDIIVRKTIMTKRAEWYGKWQIKCAYESKASMRVAFEDCIFEYAGMDGGSTGYIIQLTPRNQNNRTPYASVQDTTFTRCTIRKGGGAVNFLGTDDKYPSGPLKNVVFDNVMFDQIDKTTGPWKGTGNVWSFNRNPEGIKFRNVTVQGGSLNSILYITGVTRGFELTNARLAPSTYRAKIDGGGQGWVEFKRVNPDAVINFTDGDRGAEGYPV